MSRKQIYGITLTAEEKRMAGYDRASGFARATTNAPAPKPQYAGIAACACRVTLPDGTTCDVSYTRYGGGGSHIFAFHSPLSEREYGNGSLADGASIEARAQELVGRVWRKAQAAEQKTMRLPSAPSHLVHTLDKTPQLTCKTAQRFAGLYAVCLRYPSGILTPLSQACERLADALSDLGRMQAGSKQTLVVGLCCRWARRWQEPRFLLDAPAENDAQDTAGLNALGANAANPTVTGRSVAHSSTQAQAGKVTEEQDRREDSNAPDTDQDGVEDEEEEEEDYGEEDYGEEEYEYPDEDDPDEADPDERDPGNPFEATQP